MDRMKRCAVCGLDVDAFVLSCPHCGSDRFFALQLYCPVCNHPVQEGRDHCLNCGTVLAVQPQLQWKQCPRCGSPMPIHASGCQRCGWSASAHKPVQPKKKKNNFAWLWILLLIPVLVLGIMGAKWLDDLNGMIPDLNVPSSTTAGRPNGPSTAPTTLPSSQPSEPEIPTTQPTAPTAPTISPTEPPVEANPIPEELRNNLYLNAMGDGYCEELTGDVMVTVIFLSDTISSWDSSGVDATKNQLNSDILRIEKDAATYGAQLDLEITYLESTIPYAYDREDDLAFWAFSALGQHGLEDAHKNQSKLEDYYGVDQAPIVFILNREGRAYAMSALSGKATEYAVLYSEEPTAFYHELSHVFGAKDFYFPEETLLAAEQYLSGSIMRESATGTMDELTAFLIGWTDTLSENAEAFLRATNHLTEEYLEQSKENDQLTGFGTKNFGHDTYTGYMVFGIPHGEGSYTWADGSRYVGNFENGMRTGYGEITTSDGYSYKGEWKDNKRHGQGTALFAGGDSYVGEFVDDQFHGKGTYTWATGTVYTGDWVNNQRHGKGKMTWTSGSYYDGDWKNNTQNGYGVYYYANYDTRYEGDFVDGKRHGWGTYYYADGEVYTGKWENDARVD